LKCEPSKNLGLGTLALQGGEDVSNIPFLGPNARVSSAAATFWIERVKSDDSAGPPEFFQLQYTQLVLLDFNGLSWPHVSVATLTATG
jgi:hypothetical protein